MQITINEDTSFFITDELGDASAGNEQGLYYDDTRFLSVYQLRLNDHQLRPLTARTLEHYHAVHLLSNPVGEALQPESLTIGRHRLVGQGLHEDIELTSHLDEPLVLLLDLRVAADFLHIFQVRGHSSQDASGGVPPTGVVRPVAHGWGIHLAYALDQPYPATDILFSQPPQYPAPDLARFRVTLGPRGSWHMCVDIVPLTTDQSHHRPSYSCQRPPAMALLDNRLRRQRERLAAAPRLETDYYPLQEAYERALRDLLALQFQGETLGIDEIVLAAGIPWFMALFGRDSLITAYQALPYFPHVAPGVLRALARLQGTRVVPETEEAPGKILHEYRRGAVPAPRSFIPTFPYYGSIDATPLFLVLLTATYRHTGDQDLVVELWEYAERALAWLDEHGDRDGDGFLEYLRSTDTGLVNQGWKDSWDAIRFRDGRIADPPIALCEVQGYAYAARLGMADLYDTLGQKKAAAEQRQRAQTLAERFNRDFWLPARGYYALALDGAKRPVDGLASNAGQALWTGIVARERAAQVADTLLGPELFSGWGVRTMGAAENGYSPVGYHTGTVWPHDNSLIVAGLARVGCYAHASRLIDAQLAAVAGLPNYRPPELFAGYGRAEYSFVIDYPVACAPQAWATGAIMLLVTTMLGLDVDAPHRRITLHPCLPPKINRLRLVDVRVGSDTLDVELLREHGQVISRVRHAPPGYRVAGAVHGGGLFW
ncbi:MAG TPA: glycogen debranching N-terminal domain-containing protein [Chloroflexota bacterium]|nr:glycogen debranching N-terminal domain-containing protein [Chloroflexota bacterium]